MAEMIPVLDLGPLRAGEAGALQRLGAELRRAFTEVGFYFVRNHGVPQPLVDEVFEAARRFHDLPMEQKLAIRFNEDNVGYMPMRGSTTRMNALGTIYKPNANAGGAMRDHVMGIRFVNGAGEVVRSGGRVLKNVTGLDLCKLLAGSHGTLGVLTEVTLKVLPAPEASGSVALRVADLAAGVRALSAGLGSPFGPSGAALLPLGAPGLGLEGPTAVLRIEDFSESVAYRLARLRALLAEFGAPAALLDGETSRTLWRLVREASLLGAAAAEAIWRVSVPPSAGPAVAAALREAFGAKLLLDWGGGLVWIAGPPTEAALRLSFEEHARAARAASEPQPAGSGGVLDSAVARLSGLVTVRRGEEVVWGDAAAAELERARRALEAGDLVT